VIVPSRASKRTKRLDAEIVQHYQAGESLRAIAGRLAKSHEFVRRVMIRLGIPPRPPGLRRRTVHDAEVARRYQAGETALAIAESLPISLITVRRILVRVGVPRRPPGRMRESR
jgi:hypothetical protein